MKKNCAIDAALKKSPRTGWADEEAKSKNGTISAPLDPASLTICDGCE